MGSGRVANTVGPGFSRCSPCNGTGIIVTVDSTYSTPKKEDSKPSQPSGGTCLAVLMGLISLFGSLGVIGIVLFVAN